MYLDKLEQLLPTVDKPARYVGGEWNACVKDPAAVALRIAFCFPDVYEVGMSHLGLRILYDIWNRRCDTYCERAFAPWPDMQTALVRYSLPLTTLETHTPLRDFDAVAFTLQYELSYTNVLLMLDLGGIPLRSADRGEDAPLVVAGGPCAYNPEPLAPFVDLFLLGDGEHSVDQLAQALIDTRGLPKAQRLLHLAQHVEGCYVPRFYDVTYTADNRVDAVTPNAPVPCPVQKAVVADLDAAPFPEKPILPYMGVIHDRVTLEIFRGCTRGCRFCQAGYVYRPLREKSLDTLQRQAASALSATGYEEVSLCSLSSGDYPHLSELLTHLVSTYGKQGVSVALPSLRIDSFLKDYAQQMQEVRKSSLTFAPEAGSQRLRDVINKGVTEEDLLRSVQDAFESGWNKVKLYFMIGLPMETQEDLEAMAALCEQVIRTFYALKNRPKGGVTVTASASTFVPKPFTPFQWCPQASVQGIWEKQQFLKSRMRKKHLTFQWHDAPTSNLEACFARGDRKLGDVLEAAYRLGCRLDGWREHFRPDLWKQAFAACDTTMAHYAQYAPRLCDTLPYDHLSAGVSKAYLQQEYRRALRGETTPDCRQGCQGCGLEDICQ